MKEPEPFLKIVRFSSTRRPHHGMCHLCHDPAWNGFILDTHTHHAVVCHSCFLLAASMFYSLSAYTDTVGTFKKGKEVI